MAKKSFSKGIDAFFEKKTTTKQEPNVINQEDEFSKLEKRATFLVELDQLQKIKGLAYWERTTLKSVLSQALDMFFTSKGAAYVNKALDNYTKNNPEGSEN